METRKVKCRNRNTGKVLPGYTMPNSQQRSARIAGSVTLTPPTITMSIPIPGWTAKFSTGENGTRNLSLCRIVQFPAHLAKMRHNESAGETTMENVFEQIENEYIKKADCGCYACDHEVQPGHFLCRLPSSRMLELERAGKVFRSLRTDETGEQAWRWYTN